MPEMIPIDVDQLDRLMNPPLIQPSVADNLVRLLEDARRENGQNDAALKHNLQTKEIDKLIPYQNVAFLALCDAIDNLCRE